MPRPGPRKYTPLTTYLVGLAADEVTLTLGEIEAIIGASLPRSARQARFWANMNRTWGGSAQVHAWRRAGGRVVRTQLHSKPPAVTFARVSPPHRAPDR